MPLSNTDYDALLVDWLYGELDSTEAARFETHLEENPDAKEEALAMQRVRVAAQGAVDVEPPDTATAILMHEASRRAQSGKRPGLWAGIVSFFQPVMMHPGVGAMATLVLVVGVAGALYMRGGNDIIATTTTNSQAQAPAERSLQQSTERFESAREAVPGAAIASRDDEVAEKLSESEENSYAVDILNTDKESELSDLLKVADQKQTSEKKKRFGATSTKMSGGKQNQKAKKSDGWALGAATTNALSGADEKAPIVQSADDLDGIQSPSRRAKAVPAPKREAQSWEDGQATNFRALARSKRCKEAGRVANDIRDRKPTFYKESISGSAEESDCHFYIARETKRRTKIRRSKVAKAKPARKKTAEKKPVIKQGTSVPSKAVAAPELDAVSDTAEGL